MGISLDAVSGGTVEVDWPAGTPWNEGVLVHEGELSIPVVVRRASPESPVVLVFGWQACNERVCLMPRRVEFTIAPESSP